MIENAKKGVFRHDLFKDMMLLTRSFVNADMDMISEYKHPVPAKRLRAQAKTYRKFPEDKPDREILSGMEVGQEFYIKLFDNYTINALQVKSINVCVSYCGKHNVKWVFETHKVGNELKITRTG